MMMNFSSEVIKVQCLKIISFAITTRKMLRRGCKGYLAVVRNVEVETGAVKSKPVVCEFPDVFLEGLPPEREIEFHIDVVPGTYPISMPLYRMAKSNYSHGGYKFSGFNGLLQEIYERFL